ncbi:MAG: 5'-methylthioadenosine/adenosylhomocysteine nucleosidase [Clostridia bacterium]|nr:5'-methylthioadenosine/adenosylhomocysteine nucleosidase [Clostridia bacterium]
MMKVDIGIIGAMTPEVDGLIALLDGHESETVSGVTYHTGMLGGKRVAIARCGVGKVFAAICAEAMIIKYSPRLIINTGVGGALAGGLKTTDIVIADKLCQHDMDTSPLGDPKGLISGINKIYFDADARAVEILKVESKRLSLNATVGTVASGDKFVADKSDKERIVSEFNAIACEMEGAAIAHTAFVNDTAFAVVRAMSDSADGDATMDYPTFLPIAAKNSTSLTLALIKAY